MTSVTWLQISDLHFRTDAHDKWDADIVLKHLIDDVEKRRSEDGQQPDLILVGGDIAYSGKPDEYALAATFFERLLQACKLDRDRLVIVPGNHDVDRTKITGVAKAIAASLNTREAIAAIQSTPTDLVPILPRLDAYSTFAAQVLGANCVPVAPALAHVHRIRPTGPNGPEVAILALNSAWLCAGDSDQGHIALGERQVRPALEQAAGADIVIALLHHPLDWLHDCERSLCEDLLMRGCHFILHGHLHRSGLLFASTPDASAMVIASGCSYDTRRTANRYNFVRFDPATKQGTVILREYSDSGSGFWTEDVRTYKNAKGSYAFSLIPAPAAAPSPSAPPAPPSGAPTPPPPSPPTYTGSGAASGHLIRRYLERVQVECGALPLAIIDRRAGDRATDARLSLEKVYIGLQTTTQVAKAELAKDPRGRTRRWRKSELYEMQGEMRTLSALEAAANEERMVLLGDPGSGKSTFANHLVLCLAGANLSETDEERGAWLDRLRPHWPHGPLFPLRIVLREFAASPHLNGTADGLWCFVQQSMQSAGLPDVVPALRERALAGGVLIVLDGLDEVPDEARRDLVRKAVRDFLKSYGKENRCLATCRIYAYQDPRYRLDGFAEHRLAPLDEALIDGFIDSWYQAVCELGWKTTREGEQLGESLKQAARRTDLAPLASNPLQLTMMASLQFSWGRLPDDRVELYQEMVLLLLVRWQEARLGVESGVSGSIREADLESALAEVAFRVHEEQGGAQGPADIPESLLLDVLEGVLGGSLDRAREVVDYIQKRAGLLIWKDEKIYAFPHRSYQEFLAGCHLSVQPDFPDRAAALAREGYAQWREVVLWAVAAMARIKKMEHVALDVANALCPSAPIEPASIHYSEWLAGCLAGESLLEIGMDKVAKSGRHASLVERIRGWLVAVMRESPLSAGDRAAAGRILAFVGDPRTELTTVDGMEFCVVPGGPFVMGGEMFDGEKPRREVAHLRDDYWMGRFPVTVAQLREYVESGNAVGDTDCLLGPATAPVVYVSWHEARAFCGWLTKRWKDLLPEGWVVRLPTEAEWEKAARGGIEIPERPVVCRLPIPSEAVVRVPNPEPKREYPWMGNADPNRANYDESGVNDSSVLGCFPGGVSPCGCEEMSGNVWEWTNSLYKRYPYDPKDGREDPVGDGARVLRGGSFLNVEGDARCAFRSGLVPDARYRNLGFRVVASPFLL